MYFEDIENQEFYPFRENELVNIPVFLNKYFSKYYEKNMFEIEYVIESWCAGYNFNDFHNHLSKFNDISKSDIDSMEICYIGFSLKFLNNCNDDYYTSSALYLNIRKIENEFKLKIHENKEIFQEYFYSDLESLFKNLENKMLKFFSNEKDFKNHIKTIKLKSF